MIIAMLTINDTVLIRSRVVYRGFHSAADILIHAASAI